MKKSKTPPVRWKTDIKDWTKISKETADLMLSQCEAVLADNVDTAKSISAKAEKLLSILVPIASAIVVYLLKSGQTFNFLTLTASISFVLLGLSIYFAYLNFKHYEIAIPGDFPKKLVLSKFIDNDLSKEQQYISMVLSICENIQERLDVNAPINDKRIDNNRLSIFFLITLPACPVLSYFYFLVCEHCF